MKKIALGLVTLLMLQGCNSHDAKLIKTFLVSDIFKKHNDASISYEGYAFDAIINGFPVIEISNKEKIESLKGYRDIASVRWQLLKPIRGDRIVVDVKRKRVKQHDIGKLDHKSYEVNYHALSDVTIETKIVESKNKSILVNSSPIAITEHVTNRLPIGDYVLSITARGTKNWDRKEVFVQIREEDNVSKFL